jgi:hypothetical protein
MMSVTETDAVINEVSAPIFPATECILVVSNASFTLKEAKCWELF